MWSLRCNIHAALWLDIQMNSRKYLYSYYCITLMWEMRIDSKDHFLQCLYRFAMRDAIHRAFASAGGGPGQPLGLQAGCLRVVDPCFIEIKRTFALPVGPLSRVEHTSVSSTSRWILNDVLFFYIHNIIHYHTIISWSIFFVLPVH